MLTYTAIATPKFTSEARLYVRIGRETVNLDPTAQQRWGLRRISIQPRPDGRCAVVAHSSDSFAADHLDVYGANSAAARMLALPVDAGREDTVIEALSQAVTQCLAPWVDELDISNAAPNLMRWGAAFPLPPGLPRYSGAVAPPHRSTSKEKENRKRTEKEEYAEEGELKTKEKHGEEADKY